MEFINITLRFWMFLLVLCLCRMSGEVIGEELDLVLPVNNYDGNVADNVIPEHAEWLKSIRYYELVNPYRMEGRAKRHASTRLLNQENGHVESTTLVFNGTKYQFTLDITLNKGLFSPEYKETHVLGNGARTFNQKLDHCFYHGRVREDDKSTVSLSTCNGIEGIITTSEGTYFIHPLKSKAKNVVEEHVVYRSDDVDEKPMTCGQSHIISPKEEFHYLKEAANLKGRVRRDIKSETKYLELFIINDRAQYRRYKNGTELLAKQLVNHLDSIYRVHEVRIVLVQVETWKEKNLIVIAKRANDTLYNLLKYKNENLDKDKGKHWDNIQLLSGTDFEGSTVGFAPIGSICGRRSAAVVQDRDSDPAVTASTMAHELGHNLGMSHDKSPCECPIENGKCIMFPTIAGIVTQFSTCSVNELEETLKKGFGTCLFDKPTKIYGPAICGNGFVEEGEQCDCGKKEECEHENKCCNATTCMLQPGAACSHGECCENCQFRSRGVLCRKKHDECDLPEFCTGENELCPEDTYVHDGIPCSNNEGYCYNAVCRSIKLQCQYLFGKDVDVAIDLCYKRNAGKKNPYYGCYSEALGGHTCALRDVKCGRITCKSDKKMLPIVGQDRGFSSVTYDGKMFCLAPTVTHGDGEDYEYAQEGTKCGTDKMCKDAKCIPVTEAVPVSAYDKCPKNCSGNGICNHKGNCHCNSGYACPDCSSKGPDQGGSKDSGQGCEPVSSGVNVAAAVLIPLFLIIIIIIAVIAYLKRRTIRERISRYKLVRRTVARSSSRANTHSTGPSTNARPTIIGPSTMEFKSADSHDKQPFMRRDPPPRPTARPAADEPEMVPSWPAPQQPFWPPSQQPSWPPSQPTYPASQPSWPPSQPPPPYTPQQPAQPARPVPPQPSVPRRPPAIPAHVKGEPRTGHQSVPLFPPSAVQEPEPEPQQRARPRPPPPRPGNQSVSGSSPPKPLPGKPRLPPSKHLAGHSSIPDLPSTQQPKPPPATQQTNVPPRPKPRVPPGSHRSVPEFPDELPVPKPRNVAPRPGHQSVPLFDLPDSSGGDNVQTVKPSAVKASQAKPSPPRKPRASQDDNKPVDFRAALKPVPKPWEKA